MIWMPTAQQPRDPNALPAVTWAGQRPSGRPQAAKSQVRHHQAPDSPALRRSMRLATRACDQLVQQPLEQRRLVAR